MLFSGPPGAGGGISRYETDLIEAVSEVRDVELATVYVKPETFWRLAFLFRSFKAFRAHRADWVMCGHIQFLPVAWILKTLFGARIWLQLHGIEAWTPSGRWRVGMVSSVDLATSVSRYTRDRFLHWSRLPPHKVRVLPNTVSAPSDSNAKRMFGDSYPVLTTVSRLDKRERYKGHREVIASMPAILAREPEALYVIAGEGDDMPNLKRYAQEQGVSARVLFLGEVDNEQRDQLYQSSDLFVMPSRGEGFGIVFLEAMSHGCQVLGLADDGSLDPMQNGALGHVAEVSTLARDILTALRHPIQDVESRVLATFGVEGFKRHVSVLIREMR